MSMPGGKKKASVEGEKEKKKKSRFLRIRDVGCSELSGSKEDIG